jgi:hypothetical protein
LKAELSAPSSFFREAVSQNHPPKYSQIPGAQKCHETVKIYYYFKPLHFGVICYTEILKPQSFGEIQEQNVVMSCHDTAGRKATGLSQTTKLAVKEN